MINGMVPNYGLKFNDNKRLGIMIEIPASKGPNTRFKTLKENSMTVEGAKIFNALPKTLRVFKGTCSQFKGHLDEFLTNVPDHPNGYGELTATAVDLNCKPSNTIRDWTRQLHLADWRTPALEKENGRTNEDDDRDVSPGTDAVIGTKLVYRRSPTQSPTRTFS